MTPTAAKNNQPRYLAILASFGACDRAISEPLAAHKQLVQARHTTGGDFGLLAALKKRSALMML